MKKRDRSHVCAILYEGLSTFEFAIATEIFGLPRPDFGAQWYQFTTASEGGGWVTANTGFAIQAQHTFEALETAGTIVIPGWPTEQETPPPELSAHILRALDEGARLVSICSGAFLLAALGLLSGRRATTHWLYADKLQARYPDIEVDPNVLFVDTDPLITSAGSAAGIDLLLHLVRQDYGAEKANIVARRLVVPPHRDGDQRQYIPSPIAHHQNDRLRPLLDQVRAAPQDDWTIDEMASAAAMSRRTFIRKFRAATGQSPTSYVRQMRLQLAKDALECSEASLDDIAETAGFGSLSSMTYHFANRLGCSPNAYRQRFRQSP